MYCMYIKLSTDSFVCYVFCLSIIDNTNLSTDIECNSAAAINNIAHEGRCMKGMQNFPLDACVLIHFIKWMSCSGWFHSPGYGLRLRGLFTRSSRFRFRQPRLLRAWWAHLPRCFIAIFIFHWPLPCCTCLLARTCFICLRLRLLLPMRVRLWMRLSMPNEYANGLVILNWFWLGGTHMEHM